MTAPGPIQMLGIPHVSPGPVMQAPGFAEQVQPGLSALANLLALRQRKAELDQQAQELQFRVGQAKQEAQWRDETGKALQTSLLGLDTTLQPTMLPNVDPSIGGMIPFQQPNLGPVARAVVNAPPGTSFDFTRLGSGIIAEAFRRQAKAQEQATGVKPDTYARVDAQGYTVYVTANPTTGKATAKHVLKDPAGPDNPSNWLREEIPGAGGAGGGIKPDGQDFYITDPDSPNYGGYTRLAVSPGTVVDPKKFFPAGQIKPENDNAANFAPVVVTAYEQARNAKPVSEADRQNLSTFIGSLNQGDPDQTMTNVAITQASLSPEARRWMQAMLSMSNSFVYAVSGKAVTRGEFMRFLQSEAPLLYEDEATQEAKWRRIDERVEGLVALARPALARRGVRPPDFDGVRARLMGERVRQETIRQIMDRLRIQHPNWDANKLASEALQAYRNQQPLVAPARP